MMAVLEQVATFNPRLAEIRRANRRYYVQRNTTSIRRWQEQGLVDAASTPSYAASALGSMIDRSAYVWIVLGEPYEFEEAASSSPGCTATLSACRTTGTSPRRPRAGDRSAEADLIDLVNVELNEPGGPDHVPALTSCG